MEPRPKQMTVLRVLAGFLSVFGVSAACWLAGAGVLLPISCAPGVETDDDDDDDDDDGPNDGNHGGMNGGHVDGGGGTNGEGANFRFAVIGDYGDDDNNTRDVSELIKSWNPEFILTVGDNDYSDGAYRGTFEGLELAVGQYFHEFIGNYEGTEGPGANENRFFPTPGDHDWGDTCDDPDGLDDYLRYFTLPSGNSGNERYYDFRMGPVHFFSIHSLDGCEPDGVTADSVQGRWVEAAALSSDAALKIAYFHNPPYSSGARHVGEGEHMRWPFAEWGFDLVFSGDDHVYERLERDGVTYVIDGLGGVDIHEFVDTPVDESVVRYSASYGAVRVDVFDDRLEAAFVAVDGGVVDEFVIRLDGGEPATDVDWYQPTVETTWQWQLQPDSDGEINTSYDVEVYDVDLFDVSDAVIDELHAAGRRVICYFSAGSFEEFRDDADEFLPDDLGATLDGFEDERWLDVRSDNVRRIMLARLDHAAARGCDGVEPDNVDGYANDSGLPLTAEDQIEFNRFLAQEAHARGLSVGLKNDLDQIAELVEYFDFAVNEQCHEYDECELLQLFIETGKPVFNAEYDDPYVNNSTRRAELCESAMNNNLRTLILPLDLDDSFRFSCEP